GGAMIITSASLHLASSHRSLTQEETLVQGSILRDSGPAGQPVARESSFAQRENVSLQTSQSSQLYSRSEIRRAGQDEILQVQTREQALQALVSLAYSRDIQIRNTTPLGNQDTPARTAPTGQAIGIQAAA